LNQVLESKSTSTRLYFYEKLRDYLEITHRLFQNQLRVRDQLYGLLKEDNRFDLGKLEYEEMFETFHNDMSNEELKRFRFIRELTEDIAKYNSEMFQMIDENKDVLNDGQILWDLYDHIKLWIAKYRSQKDNPHMCLVYTGVEDKKGFPYGIEKFVSDRINGLKNLESPQCSIQPPVKAINKTRLLFLSSNPYGNLNIDSEFNKIELALKKLQNYMKFELIRENDLDEADMWKALQNHMPAQIIHISGMAEDERGIKLLDKGKGASRLLGFDRLSDFFEQVSKNNKIRLGFLSTCYSGNATKKISKYVDCAIGIHSFVEEEQAIKFIEIFYESLGEGKSVKDAFESGQAYLGNSVKISLEHRDGIDPSTEYFT